MFGKYLSTRIAREEYVRKQIGYRDQRIAALQRDLSELEGRRKKIEAEIERERADPLTHLPSELKPSDRLIACAAYLYDCASASLVPTYYDAAERSYMVTGAALSSALKDALALGWIGQTKEGALYWRDAGLSEECPLVILAKMHRK